ncbi:MAG: DUF3800 domain-containing protein [Thermomicrobiales bacterium]
MTETYNVYCDESCHQEHDRCRAMVIGAVWAPLAKVPEITQRLREIKAAHGKPAEFEIKWNKVSPAGVQLYLDWINYFFDDDDLHFRALVVPDKSLLRHDAFGQDHDTWYYTMYFSMLEGILEPNAHYRIYLDIKDTRSASRVANLHRVLANSVDDFSRQIVERLQSVRSHEVEILQLADLLIGAVSYANRELNGSPAKSALVHRIRERSGYSLLRSTLVKESKLNVFVWHAADAPG